MDRKVKRCIALALKESTRSTYGRISIGAVIHDGKRVVSRGHNSTRTHPAQAGLNAAVSRPCKGAAIHAEISALVRGHGRELAGCTIYVGRFDRSGALANCKPCSACQHGLRLAGIKKCFYTDTDGIRKLIIE